MEGSHLRLFLLLTALTALPPSSAAKERCHPHDKNALLRIKQQSFPNSTLLESWTPTTDCCDSWTSIRCSDTSPHRVTSFTLLGSDTEHTPFPSSLADLPYLEQIIFHNSATGPIPSSLSNLHHLLFLDLSINRLTGPIPSFLSSLRHLTYLDLSRNLLSGPIPPSLSLLPNLSTLDLSYNRLTGPVPSSFGLFKSKQMSLSLSYNTLSGKLPTSLANVEFASVELAGNGLKGDPSFLLKKDNKVLWDLNLAENEFRFDLTTVEFPEMMNVLDLSKNRIYGGLPEGLTHLPQLNLFNVSYNRLCGRIPKGGTLGQFDKTTYLYNKCLCGTPLPACK